MTNQTPSKDRYNQMNSENNKEIFERKSIHKLLKEVHEHNLSLEYPDKSDSESEIDYLQEFTKFGEFEQHLKKEFGLNLRPERYPRATEVFNTPELILILFEELEINEDENLFKYRGINRLWRDTIDKNLPKFHSEISFRYKIQEQTLNLFLDLIQTSPGTRAFLKEKSKINLKGGRIAKQICEITGITEEEYKKDLKTIKINRKDFKTNGFLNQSDNTDPKYFD